MVRNLSGNLDGSNMRVAVIASRFNGVICDRLLEGAMARLKERGVSDESIMVIQVPGAFELSFAVHAMEKTGQIDAIVALGCVVRGQTPHFDYICTEAARGINEVNCRGRVPAAFGVLTTDTMDQAMERSGGSYGNKGAEAVDVAIEMTNLRRALDGGSA